MNNNFFDFLKGIGIDKNQARIEMYRVDGTSNYLISLNYSGVTWAVAIRLPAMGTEYSKFEKEKTKAVDTAEFLAKHFGEGISLSNNITFCFKGNSNLVSYNSVMEFFSFQNTLPSLTEVVHVDLKSKPKIVGSLSYPDGIDELEKLTDEEKEQVKEYLSEYRGDFFVSRGAPASETLDDFWDMISDITHTLSVLHTNSGLKSLIPVENVLTLAKEFDDELVNTVSTTSFSEGTSVYKSFQKHQKKRNPNNDSNISELIKKEMILRTKKGKDLLSGIIGQFEKTMKEDKSQYSCFTHNDPHCENFIIVKYLYDIQQNNHQYIDREFVNNIIQNGAVNSSERISIIYDKDYNQLKYRKFEEVDLGADNVNIIYPRARYDIHLIDIDEATGITPNEQKMYIYDLLIYALSIQNISETKGERIPASNIIRSYYKNIEK